MAQSLSPKGASLIKGYTKSHRMAMLTFGLIGLQFTWGVEMTYFNPYLLQLGLAKSQASLVWIAPPLSGVIVQPIIGVFSDKSTSRWGRRRPYMIVSSVLVVICMLTLGWAAELVGFFAGDENVAKRGTIALAVLCIYAVDFALNAVQATARGLIVDTLPASEQQLGSAWAGRMLGFGQLLGYLAGTLDLIRYLGTGLGSTQFKQISIVTSFIILSCTSVTCFCVEERTLPMRDINANSGIIHMFSDIVRVTLQLPKRIQAICWITFWSWIGWSPFYVYGSTWIGETYYRQNPARAAELKSSADVVGDVARKGSFALSLVSVIAFIGSIILPWIVKPSSDQHPDATRNVPSTPNSTTKGIHCYRPDITLAWGLSQIIFGTAMILTPVSHSFGFATTLIALCGLPWAMYTFAPLALLGEEINMLEPIGAAQAYSRLPPDEQQPVELSRLSTDSIVNAPPEVSGQQPQECLNAKSDMAGSYIGIWNMSASIPQFLATFISMVAFSILEPGVSTEFSGEEASPKVNQGLSGTAVCLAVGAICSFIAAGCAFRLRKLHIDNVA